MSAAFQPIGQPITAPPKFPVNRLQVTRKAQRHALNFFHEVRQWGGDVVTVQMLSGPLVLCSHPDCARAALGPGQADYDKTSMGNRIISWLIGDGIISALGDDWTRQYRMVKPTFKRPQIEAYSPHMETAIEASIKRLDACVGQTTLLHSEMMRVTLDIIGRVLFGTELLNDRPDTKAFRQVTDEINASFYKIMNGLPLPPNPITPMGRRMQRYERTRTKFLLNIVAEARADRKRFDNTLLGLLLEAADDPENDWVDDKHLSDQLFVFLSAGHETSTNALTATWFLLARHPEVLAQLREEWAAVLGGAPATAQDISGLVYTQQVIKESMRLYPPAWATGRRTVTDSVMMGHELKANTDILIFFDGIHQHPDFWPDPKRFDPDRFAGPLADKFAWLPFGAGKRICTGNFLSMIEMTLILATLGQRFDFEIAPDYSYNPSPLITQEVADHLPVFVKRRNG